MTSYCWLTYIYWRAKVQCVCMRVYAYVGLLEAKGVEQGGACTCRHDGMGRPVGGSWGWAWGVESDVMGRVRRNRETQRENALELQPVHLSPTQYS